MPTEFMTPVEVPADLQPGESWVAHLNLYVIAFFAQRDLNQRAAAWRALHPGC